MAQWAAFPWDAKMYASADETLLSRAVAAVENGYANPAGGMSRFPGLASFVNFGVGGSRTYLTEFRGNMMAATDQGRLYRVDRSGAFQDVTGVPISGGKRVVFSQTEDMLVMAAGGPILRLAGARTQQLSADAPQSTHVGFIDGYLLAIEQASGRFSYCVPGEYTVWNPASVFSANGKPDDLNALAISPFREVLLTGIDSVEQYETFASGTQPFARRWTTGTGIMAPYTLLTDETGTYGVNKRHEFARFVGQVVEDQSANIALVLEKVDDWRDAWAAECGIKGQKFILLQMPFATNAYGTQGITMLLDYRNKRWSFLYGWDDVDKRPARWPGWSVLRIWGKMYVGVAGGVAELTADSFQILGRPYPWLVRSAHVDKFSASRIDNCEIRIKRGVGAYESSTDIMPRIGLRVNRDNLGFDQWMFEDLGRPGERDMSILFGSLGSANTWQIELAVTDNVPVEFSGMNVRVERLSW
ncbi:hypothetical protein UFOVP469_5 [uncultured Caudovirales phage]|uniref:Bacteriophage P22, Gp10, DNA-stabilising n=1 Tax=uncultured Caudovirales phage TaxID=2100421 RepID=A0A6J5R2C8_9CAUD|nr:hypothetical protein UFOVP469_5 [uncultured Caudovirales phage]CAB4190082.1 hypothetical protein UFOVP1200_35 [uncultured Caudovirales phage]